MPATVDVSASSRADASQRKTGESAPAILETAKSWRHRVAGSRLPAVTTSRGLEPVHRRDFVTSVLSPRRPFHRDVHERGAKLELPQSWTRRLQHCTSHGVAALPAIQADVQRSRQQGLEPARRGEQRQEEEQASICRRTD